MIKQVLIAILLIVTFNNSTVAQFYYKDILSNKEAIAERKMLEAQKKKTVVVKSFESATEESKDFFCEKKISADYLKIETKTRSGLTGKSILTSFFNKKGLLVKSTDGEESNATVSTYSYDHTDNLIQITTTSHSSYDGFVTLATEVHQYSYNDKGMPLRLLVIKND
ncbi:MAG: RHS repeat protein [Sphingobacteriales bacterium]|nr:RHS repeat protein [Sphingobacteriales bacterium]